MVGASNHERMSYLLWQEPKAPDWVLEITSRSTRHEDQGRKRELYRRLGVSEYRQFDPTGDYLRPVLQGLELVAGEYQEMPCRERGDGTLVMASAVPGLELRVTGRGLRFHDPETGRDLLTHAEERAARRQAEAKWQRAEARIRELEALLRTRAAEADDAERPPVIREQPDA